MRLGKALAAIVTLLAIVPGASFAKKGDDAPIVYAARYYNAPTSKQRSYFHLYRIDPDGTGRRQLTSADADDSEPHWSPDGRRILFVRETIGNLAGSLFLYVMNSDGTGERRIYSNPKPDHISEPRWEEDGQAVRITRDDGKGITIAVRDGTTQDIPESRPTAALPTARADNDGVTVTSEGAENAPALRCLYDSALLSSIKAGQADPDSFEEYGYAPNHGPLLLRSLTGDSTSGHWYIYYAVNEKERTVTRFAEGGSLNWSPDGTHFVTTAGRDLAPNGTKPGDDRMVWVSPLLLGTVHGTTATIRPIVTGTVYVTGGDWRPTNNR